MTGLRNYVGKMDFQFIRVFIYFFLHLILLDSSLTVIVILTLLSDVSFRFQVAPNITI